MSAPVDPVVLGYRADPLDLLDRLVLFLPDDWMMVLLRPYSDDLRAQIRAENDADDLDYLVSFSQGGTERFWFSNCIDGLGLGLDDDGDPFLQIEFEPGLAEQQIFDGTDFYVGFEDPVHTYGLFDQLVNVLDPEARAPLPVEPAAAAQVDPALHPNVAAARARRATDVEQG